MRGSIRPGKTKGTYIIILSTGKDPVTQKYKQEWITVRGTKKDAETRLAEEIRLKDTGFNVKADKIPLVDFLKRFLKDYAKPNLSPRTYEGYESIINVHLIPSLGRLKLSELRADHIQSYYTKKLETGRFNGKGGLNSSTVRHHAMCLHCALDIAVKWKLIPYNPADGTSPPPMNHGEMHTLSENDVRKFLDAAKPTPYYALYYVFLFTGIRRSEALSLKWMNISPFESH
jgi:integrase